MRPEHKPLNDPCLLCNHPASAHRVYHAPLSDPCEKCGLPASNHRIRDGELQKVYSATYRATEKGKEVAKKHSEKRTLPDFLSQISKREKKIPERKTFRPKPQTPKESRKAPYVYLGVDGEGQGRIKHAYVLLAASNLDGSKTWSVEDSSWRKAWNQYATSEEYPQGRYEGPIRTLPTRACADFLLALPKRSKAFSFAFNYDITKIIEDIPDDKIYKLMRPEKRPNRSKTQKFNGPEEVKAWRKEGYHFNLQGTKFIVRKRDAKRIIWDIFKFYGSKFVSALESWKVGNKELYERMTLMKDKRGEFDKEPPNDVETYCLEECMCMAQLAKKLDDAHKIVGLPLTAYYGAGSSASAMLKAMAILEQLRPLPETMREAIACSFFGGRFEIGEIGEIEEEIFTRDISSAYPYQLYFLPCLVHGTWKVSKKRKDIDKKIALIHYGFDKTQTGISQFCKSWGPFPFRDRSGSICFPALSGGGWVYQDEYLAGEKLFPHVRFREAWVYEQNCDCRPFEKIAHYYLFRLFLGKEGAGLVIKLAINSCYGKLAQSIGTAKFNCWLWAAMITSGCRGQLLNLMGKAKDLSDILMVATDGIASRSYLPYPDPKDTGTGFLLSADGKTVSSEVNKKPLGGWEAPQNKDGSEKVNTRGIFLARPGIYFPLEPSKEDIKEIKGRGLGRGVILDSWGKIVKSWRENGMSKTVKVANVSRFCGAKTSISKKGKPGKWEYTRADGSKGIEKPFYGNWVMRTVEMGFNPLPKREGVSKDGKTLVVRKLDINIESTPYRKSLISAEARELKVATEEALEQPEVDFSIFGEFVDGEL